MAAEQTVWSNFFTTVAGASATLTGLLFVGVSINLQRILSMSGLADRALQALLLLVGVLVSCLLMLVPDQGPKIVGFELIIIGLLLWLSVTWLDAVLIRKTGREHRKHFIVSSLINQLAIIPFFIAGVQILTADYAAAFFETRWLGNSVSYWQLPAVNAPGYWFVGGLMICIVKAIFDAWVLLIEINR